MEPRSILVTEIYGLLPMHRVWHRNELIKATVFYVVVGSGLVFLLIALHLPVIIDFALGFSWGFLLRLIVSDQWELSHWERGDEGGA